MKTVESAAYGDNYRIWLAEKLAERRRKNPSYSLRRFSRFLGFSHASLSQVLSGKRPLTLKGANKITERLALSPEESGRLSKMLQKERGISALSEQKAKASDFTILEMDQFHLISDWYHYAILSLLEIPGVKADSATISRRLGISAKEAEAAIVRLERLELIDPQTHKLPTKKTQLGTPTFTAPALRRFHLGMLKKAEESIERDSAEETSFSSITMAIDPKFMQEAKAEIKRFRRAMCQFLESGKQEKVYSLSIHLFPLDQETPFRKPKGKEK